MNRLLHLSTATVFSIGLLNASAAAVLCVDVNGTNALAPYADWSTAATNIQDAVDLARDGDTVLVTSGVYRTGGRIGCRAYQLHAIGKYCGHDRRRQPLLYARRVPVGR